MEWHPSRFFRASGASTPYALLVLNQPINERAFGVLSEHASFIICADGGANRLYDMMQNDGKESSNLPDAVVGDLDSIRPPVREHYDSLKVPILEDPDQYSTDFTKCLTYLNAHAAEILAAPRRGRHRALERETAGTEEGENHSFTPATSNTTKLEILILGGLGGRVDQAFSQIHHLYLMTQTQRTMRERHDHDHDQKDANEPSQPPLSGAGGNLYLVSEESMTFILQAGKNVIYTPGTRRPDVDIQEEQEQEGLPSSSSPSSLSLSLPPKPQTQESATAAEAAAGAARKRKRGQEPEEEVDGYFFEENVGIIPLSAPVCITTHGLEWDVRDWYTEIGGQISTSNHIRAERVEVETSGPVLFTLELASRLKRRLR